MKYFAKGLLAAALAVGVATPVLAQDASDYPNRTVTIEVPFSAGGSTDVFGRLLAEWLGEELGGTFIVENTTGASGVIGTQKVATSDPDGYNILLATPSPLVMQPLIQDELPYELWEDFRPLSLLWVQPVTLITRKDRFATVEEFIAAAKERPGEITFGSAGINSLNHISGVFFQSLADIELLHIPYQGINPAIADTLAGNVDASFVTAASLLSMPDELHGLVAASERPLPGAPNVPLSGDVGLDDYIFSSYGAFIVPAETPDAVVDKLQAALTAIFEDPEKLADMENRGVSVDLKMGDELKAFAENQSSIAAAAIEK